MMALEAGQLLLRLETPAYELMIETGLEEQLYLYNLNQTVWPSQTAGQSAAPPDREPMTKRQVILYYANTLKLLMPYLQGQAVLPLLYPKGINGDYFYPALYSNLIPAYVHLGTCRNTDRGSVLMDNAETLFYLLNLGAISFDFPLKRSLAVQIYSKKEEAPYSAITLLALTAKAFLEKKCGTAYVKPFQFSRYPTDATGNMPTEWHGLDIITPLSYPITGLERVYRELYEALSAIGIAEQPTQIHLCCRSQEKLFYAMALGQIYAPDIGGIVPECVAPYSLMACAQPLVSAPINWNELNTEKGQPEYWTWKKVLEEAHNRQATWKEL